MGERRWMVQEEGQDEEGEGSETVRKGNKGDKKVTRKMSHWMKEENKLKRERGERDEKWRKRN